jgi:general secretion pathway protein J
VLVTAKARQPTTGFTLLEMLVALALVSTITAMVYGSFAATGRSLDLYGRRMACGDRTLLVLRLLSRQLRCAYLPTAAATEPFAAGGQTLSFITTAGVNTASSQPAALSRIVYRYDPGAGTLSICGVPCVYGASPAQDPGNWRPLLSGVRSMDFQFYDGRQWQSGWSDIKTLPAAVQIALTVIDERERPHEFTTMVPIGGRIAPPRQEVRTAGGL